MQQKLGVRDIKQAMSKVVYKSADWHALCLLLCQKLYIEGDYKEGAKYAEKVDESKLAAQYKANYHTVMAEFAEKEGAQEKTINQLKIARDADRALTQPTQQFALTKQIAWTYDSLGQLDEAVAQWERLIDDLNNFKHSEHQPMLAYKFLSQTLIKMGKVQEAEAARLRWANDRLAGVLKIQNGDHFKSSNPPDNYDDELSNYFETLSAKRFLAVREGRNYCR